YNVEVAPRGSDALTLCRRQLPDLIVLDIMLPDMDGYAVCRELRTTTRTKHIPIIFLTQKDERSDRIAGLELGADDYITKPFDIEELKLRVRQAINTYKRTNMTDPITGLPRGKLIEEELLQLMRTGEDWTLGLVGIDHMRPFVDTYGFVAGDEVRRFTAMLMNRVIDDKGTMNDFVGNASDDSFVVITLAKDVHALVETLRQRFKEEIRTHYNFMDAEQGGVRLSDGTLAPLMSLSVGTVSSDSQSFSDIREITELAAELRILDQQEQAKKLESSS
ncbi:MAG: response regulator, partial [Anaerolineales bacterium]|nr:response regulator [Anaerolineales bacterium]